MPHSLLWIRAFGRVPRLVCCHWFSSHLTAVQTCWTLLSRQHLSEAYESSNTALDRQFPKSVHVSLHTRKDIKLFEDLSVVCPVGSSAVQHCMASAPFHTSRTNTTDKLALDHQTSVIQTSLCSVSQRERETDSAMSHQFVMLVLSCSILMQGRCFFTLFLFPCCSCVGGPCYTASALLGVQEEPKIIACPQNLPLPAV